MEDVMSNEHATVSFTLQLTADEAFAAAHIGLNRAILDRFEAVLMDIEDNPRLDRLLNSLARYGVCIALDEARERLFPSRYPDDLTEDELSTVIPFPPSG